MKQKLAILIILIIFCNYSIANKNNNWFLVKQFKVDKHTSQLISFSKNKSDIDIKIISKYSENFVQKSPEKINSTQYFITEINDESVNYEIYTRLTSTKSYKPEIQIEIKKIDSKVEKKYFKFMLLISRKWDSNYFVIRSEAYKMCQLILSEVQYQIYLITSFKYCGWIFIELEKYDEYFLHYNQIELSKIIDEHSKFSLMFLHALAYKKTGQFNKALNILENINKVIPLDNQILNQSLVLGNMGLLKSLISYHENKPIIGYEEISKAIEISVSIENYQLNAELFHYLSTYLGFKDKKQDALAALNIALGNILKSKSNNKLNITHNQTGVT